MIVTVPMYRVECDEPDCTASPSDDGEYSAWTCHDGALNDLDGAWDWFTHEREHRCPKHAPRCADGDCNELLSDREYGDRCEEHAPDDAPAPSPAGER